MNVNRYMVPLNIDVLNAKTFATPQRVVFAAHKDCHYAMRQRTASQACKCKYAHNILHTFIYIYKKWRQNSIQPYMHAAELHRTFVSLSLSLTFQLRCRSVCVATHRLRTSYLYALNEAVSNAITFSFSFEFMSFLLLVLFLFFFSLYVCTFAARAARCK